MKIHVVRLLVIVLAFSGLIACKKSDVSPADLVITSLSAMHAGGDSSLTIKGTGFSLLLDENKVTVNGQAAVVTSAGLTSLVIIIPKKAGDGDIIVTVQQRTAVKKGFTYDWIAKVSTLAGSSSGDTGSEDGNGVAALFNSPAGIAIDTSAGYLYIADYNNNSIRKSNLNGAVTTFIATRSHPGSPLGICHDKMGNLYFTKENAVYKVNPQGIMTLIAGKETLGSANGNGSNASFRFANGICADAANNLYVADAGNHLIRKITPNGDVTTIAGSAKDQGHIDGNGTNARFNYPEDLCVDASGNLYVADAGNNSIRKITPQGDVSTFAGSSYGEPGFEGGAGTNARFETPFGIAIDKADNLYVADWGNSRIRKITPQRIVTSIAGHGNAETIDGIGIAAAFQTPYKIAIDKNSDLYVTDQHANNIRKISLQ